MEIKKAIEYLKCPCCGTLLDGRFQGDLTVYSTERAEKRLEWNVFRFPCPRSGRFVALCETSFTPVKHLWMVEAESRLGDWAVLPVDDRRAHATILYMNATSNNSDGETRAVAEAARHMYLETTRGAFPKYVFGCVVPKSLEWLLSDISTLGWFRQTWVVPEAAYAVGGRDYPSIIAEAAIVDEFRKWTIGGRLLSMNQTLNPIFKKVES